MEKQKPLITGPRSKKMQKTWKDLQNEENEEKPYSEEDELRWKKDILTDSTLNSDYKITLMREEKVKKGFYSLFREGIEIFAFVIWILASLLFILKLYK